MKSLGRVALLEQIIRECATDAADLIDRANQLKRKQREAELELIELQWGVKVGSVVRDRDGYYRVDKIRSVAGNTKPWLSGVKRRKDGSWGSAIRNIYGDWEIVS